MLFLLRKIRQKMIQENKVWNYLLYAVGEILLVVAGILIALQIDSWNEGRVNKNERKALIEALISDFETTSMQLAERRKGITDHNVRLEKFLQNSENNESTPVDSLKHFANAAFRGLNYHPNLISYEEAVSSGKIHLVNDKIIQEYISSFFQHYKFLQNHMSVGGHNFYLGPTYEIRKKIGNLTSLGYEHPNDQRKKFTDSHPLSERAFREFVRSKEVFAMFHNTLTIQYNMKESLEEMEADAAQIIDRLKQIQSE